MATAKDKIRPLSDYEDQLAFEKECADQKANGNELGRIMFGVIGYYNAIVGGLSVGATSEDDISDFPNDWYDVPEARKIAESGVYKYDIDRESWFVYVVTSSTGKISLTVPNQKQKPKHQKCCARWIQDKSGVIVEQRVLAFVEKQAAQLEKIDRELSSLYREIENCPLTDDIKPFYKKCLSFCAHVNDTYSGLSKYINSLLNERNRRGVVKSLLTLVAEKGIQWNPHKEYLNTRSGVIDTSTGELIRPHPALMITRCADFEYDVSADYIDVSPEETAKFNAVLKRVTGGNSDIADYLQVVYGSALTLYAREELYYIEGPGGNGKSLLANALYKLLGESKYGGYATCFPRGVLTGTDYDKFALGYCEFCTFVFSNESGGGGAVMDCEQLKTIASRDPVQIQQKYVNPYPIEPTWTAVCNGNGLPGLGLVDEAVKSRLRLVKMTRECIRSAEDCDITLIDKLTTGELSHAFKEWLMAGAVRSLQNRTKIEMTAAVKADTAQWIDGADVIAEIIPDLLREDPKCFIKISQLRARYEQYISRRRIEGIRFEQFADEVKTRLGLTEKVWHGYRCLKGAELLPWSAESAVITDDTEPAHGKRIPLSSANTHKPA